MILAPLAAVAAQLLWAQSELAAIPGPDSGTVLHGIAVSQGAGRGVTARLTYDHSRAAGGGCIFAPARFLPEDEAAAGLSEGLVLAYGGRLSRGAALARARRIPAVVLDSARWEDGVLSVEQPVLGKTARSSGIAYQVAEKTVWLRIKEGDAVTLEPARGVLILHPAEDAEPVLAAAEAARAYDGLRDGQALLQWWQSRRDSDPRSGIRLVALLAEALAAGAANKDDFASLRRAVADALSGPDKKLLDDEERRALLEAARGTQRLLRDSIAAVRDAATAKAVEHLAAAAGPRWEGFKALAEALGQSPQTKGAAALWRELGLAAAARRRQLPDAPQADALASVAAASGAQLAPRAALDGGWLKRFLEDSGLKSRVSDIIDDASLDLRRKYARIRALILETRLAGSPLGQDILSRLPEAPEYSVAGRYETFAKVPRSEVLEKIAEAWAACYAPGPLGARKRAAEGGPAAEPDASVTVAEAVAAEISGSAFSRDPAGISLKRIVVAASRPGSSMGQDEYVLDRRTGREVLPAALGAGERLLAPGGLAQLARAARALDDHEGRGMEIIFAFAQGRLYLLGARPMPGMDEEPVRAAPSALAAPPSATVPPIQPLR